MQRSMGPMLAIVFAAALAQAQDTQTNGAPMTFEVATIKLHEGVIQFSSDPGVRNGRVSGTASTLADMITSAYGVRYDQLSIPDERNAGWMNNDRYDVDAKAPGDTPPTADQAHKMMQTLLAERFQLKVHRETRTVPIYALLVAKGGLKLKEGDPAAATGFTVTGKTNGLHLEAKRGSMQKLADQLSTTAGRPVIDQTGLSGGYAFSLDWFPENGARWFGPNRTAADGDFPSMFTAVQELGLRLESTKGPQDYLVIDRVEKPSAN